MGNSFIFLHVACPLSRRFSASSRGPRSRSGSGSGCYGPPKMMIIMGNIYGKENTVSSRTIPLSIPMVSWKPIRKSLAVGPDTVLNFVQVKSVATIDSSFKPLVSAQKWLHEATSTKPWSYIWSHFWGLVWPQTNDKPYQTCQHQPCQPISGHFNGKKDLLTISQHLRTFLDNQS